MYGIKVCRLLLVASCVIASSLLIADRTEAGVVSCLRNAVTNMLMTRLSGGAAGEFNQTVASALEEFERRNRAEMSEIDRENLLKELIVDSFRKKKEELQKGTTRPTQDDLDADTALNMIDCGFEQAWKDWNPDEPVEEREKRFREKLLEKGLVKQEEELLKDLAEVHEESEMGLALDDETRSVLKTRTKHLLNSLIENEIRQIGGALMSAYISGTPFSLSLLAPFVQTVLPRFVEFLLNALLDIARATLNYNIEIKPMNVDTNAQFATPTVTPVAA